MNCIATARAAIAQSPGDPELHTLERLLHALESETSFELDSLYELGFDRFDLAVGVLREWRLARYYSSERRLALSRMARGADAGFAAN